MSALTDRERLVHGCGCTIDEVAVEEHYHRDEVEALVADRERAARGADFAPIEAILGQWECEPNPPDQHARRCPGCARAAQVRVALDATR